MCRIAWASSRAEEGSSSTATLETGAVGEVEEVDVQAVLSAKVGRMIEVHRGPESENHPSGPLPDPLTVTFSVW